LQKMDREKKQSSSDDESNILQLNSLSEAKQFPSSDQQSVSNCNAFHLQHIPRDASVNFRCLQNQGSFMQNPPLCTTNVTQIPQMRMLGEPFHIYISNIDGTNSCPLPNYVLPCGLPRTIPYKALFEWCHFCNFERST